MLAVPLLCECGIVDGIHHCAAVYVHAYMLTCLSACGVFFLMRKCIRYTRKRGRDRYSVCICFCICICFCYIRCFRIFSLSSLSFTLPGSLSLRIHASYLSGNGIVKSGEE